MTALVVDRPTERAALATPKLTTRNPTKRSALRLGWLSAWPTLLVVSVYSRFGGTSLVSPDDGFILAQSRRILSGQIPHRDFISPRPAGSALLHCIDFLLPLPLLSASRLVSTVEVVAYTLAFAALAYRRPIRDWSIVQVAAAAAAVFVNLHSFPLMAWHTIDGILFVALGIVALRSGLADNRTRRVYGGLLLLGGALVIKQSFAPALVLGVAMVWEQQRRASRDEKATEPAVTVGRASAVVVLPILLYIFGISAAGGLSPMIVQLAHAKPVWGWTLIHGLWSRGGQGSALIALAAALCLLDWSAGRRPGSGRVARFGARAGLSALVVGVLLVTRTDPADAWGRALFLLLVVVVAWEWMADHYVDRFGLAMICVAWMTAISWGYPSPRLVAGSVALLLLDRLWRSAPALPPRVAAAKVTRIAAVFAIITAFAVMATAIHERALLNGLVVTDRSIGQVVPDLRGVRTDLTTTTLIRDVASCRARYPAQYTAVLPGPAIVDPILHLDNPFSVDWVYPLEIAGSANRLVGEARRLNAKGNYLVLVTQPDAATGAEPNPVLDRMLHELKGTRSPCGIFTAVHAT